MVGHVIGGRFRIARLLGEGGMGTVYEATHETLPRKFAIKILRPELAHDRNFIERFRREAIAAARIEHPNVIYITDFGYTEEGSVYLVMEYLEGVGLDELICRYSRLPVNRVLPILIQIADALDFAHKMNVVHRDLKPENILLTVVRGQKDFVKILDFGIAKMREPEFDNVALTMKGQVFGTAEYMSPEQATGEVLDGRSDIYAMGCLAYEMLTGEPPFVGSAVEILRAHVKTQPAPPSTKLREHRIPPSLDALVLRCLSKDRMQRYQTGAELKRDLVKVRALMFSLSDNIVDRMQSNSISSKTSADHFAQGWHSLGGEVPEFLGFTGPETMSTPSFANAAAAKDAEDPEKLREEYQEVLRELTLAMMQSFIAPPETAEILERLLVIEEEIASLTGTIALAEQNFDRIRFEYSQQEKRLRYAILDLSMEQAKIKGLLSANPEQQEDLNQQVGDLTFQISTLENRCREVESERDEQIRELDREVKRYRESRKQLEEEALQIFKNLHSEVERLRNRVDEPYLNKLFERLDQLVSTLERTNRH